MAPGEATITATFTYTSTSDEKESIKATATCAVKVKADAELTEKPTAKTLTYNSSAQELVTAGTADGGTMQYALGADAATAPESGYSASIPTGTEAGT